MSDEKLRDEMREMVEDFITETSENLSNLECILVDLEKDPNNLELLNSVFRIIHSLKGASGFLGFTGIAEAAHKSESLLNQLRKGAMTLTPEMTDLIFETVDIIKVMLDEIKTGQETGVDFKEAVRQIDKVLDQKKQGEPHPLKPGLKEKISLNGGQDQTVRVNVERLDLLMNLVGEMVLARNRLFKMNQEIEKIYGNDEKILSLVDATLHMGRLTTDLQLAVVRTRMQPVHKVFSRIPRMVRDLSRGKNKTIDIHLTGEETEVDKSIIEEIGDPLVHLIRNAVDHGIEARGDRTLLGKPEKGQIRVAAVYDGDQIMIQVEDDGKGMDPEKLRKTAVEKKLLDPAVADRLSKKECLNLIFIPGLSTAEKVTDISGRGVGMDVVKTNISRLNGSITVESNIGKGTKILMRLPISVAIIKVLMVGVGKGTFAIPLSSVIETMGVSAGEMDTIREKEAIKIGEEIVPLIQLSHEMDIPISEMEEDTRMYIVLLGVAEKKAALMVSELYGQEEIVIKPLSHYIGTNRLFSGATINGDGKVVMILDVGGLIGQHVLV